MRHFCLICVLLGVLIPNISFAQVQDDNIAVNEDTNAVITVTDNDVVPNIDVSSVDLDPGTPLHETFLALANGDISVNSSGTVTFIPDANWFGSVSVPYAVSDLTPAVAGSASINITITSVNDPPVAGNDSGSGNENTPVIVAVQINDSDIDGTLDGSTIDLDVLTAGIQSSFNSPQGDWVATGGSVTFTPILNFNGNVSRDYRINDNGGATSNSATISVTINNVNTAPVATNDSGSANENVTQNISLLVNDTDDSGIDATSVDLDPSAAGQQTSLNPASGTVNVNSSGVLQFVPAANFNGVVNLQYTVEDTDGLVSNIADVAITVVSVNPTPVANDDAGSANEDTNVNVSILANDTDDGSLDATTIDLNPSLAGQQTTLNLASGTVTLNASGVLQFAPVTNFSGTVNLQYTIKDNEGATSNVADVVITITAVNTPPVAVNDAGSANENVTVTIPLLANDTDDGTLAANSVDLNQSVGGRQNSLSLPSGTASVNNSGTLQFVPAANFNGTVTIQYTVEDNVNAVSNIADVVITINSVNSTPIANDDSGSANENVTVNISLLTNDSDVEGLNAATVDLNPALAGQQTTLSLASGAASVNASGVLQFVPTANFNGTVNLQYTVNDSNGATSNTADVVITISSVNTPPVATNDAGSANENVTVTISILANDTDDTGLNVNSVDLNPSMGGRQTSVSLASGTASVNSSGVLQFVPAANFNGTVNIQYTVEDNNNAVSNVADVVITINSVNTAPVANNDAASANENVTVNISILANDTDDSGLNAASVDLNPSVAGQQTTLSLASGNATVSAAGVLQFVPVANFSGAVSLQYTVNDTNGVISNTAQVAITFNSVNSAPVANDDSGSANENVTVNISLLANDTDDSGLDANSVDLNPSSGGRQTTLSLASGTATVNASGVLQFVPATNFSGTVTIQYVVKDVDGATSNTAEVVITISSVNSNPVAVNDAVTGNENTTLNISILANDTDVEGLDATSVDLNPAVTGQQTTLSLASGTASVNGTGVVQFVPAINFNGVVTFDYIVEDTDGVASNIAQVTITINPVNTPPIAVADATSTNEDNAVSINVVSNDTDDGSVAASTVDLDVTTPGIQKSLSTSNGNYSVDNNGVVTYTPVANFHGIATIQYVVNDDEGGTSNAATITITVNTVNDTPVAVNDAVTTNQNQAVSLIVVANDTDDSGVDPTAVDLNTTLSGRQNSLSVTEGTFTVNSSGSVTFSPVSTFSGVVTISYTVDDLQGAPSNPATITITVIRVNSKPVATNDAATTNEDIAATFNVLTNDTDDASLNKGSVDLDVTGAGQQVSHLVSGGTFAVNTNGDVTFTPTANFTGSATTRYTVTDNEGLVSDPATITVTVNTVNDAPVATADARTVNEDNTAVINLLANDVDVDGSLVASSVDVDPVTAGKQSSVSVTGGIFAVDASGVMTFTPNANFYGSATASYTVDDNAGATSNAATITITITGVNDSPVAANDIESTPQNVPASFNILTNDADPDGTINATTIDLNPAAGGVDKTITVGGGTYTVDNAGIVNFTPANNFNGTSSITYTVQDNSGATSNAATITVLVSFVNQAPVATNDVGTTIEDVAVNVNVVANDTDDGSINVASVDLDPATNGVQNTITNTFGKFTANASGVVNYVPALNFNGSATCTYGVNDNLGETSNTATITITVTSVNDVPVASDDTATGTENTALAISILTNDSDVDNALDPASIDLVPGTPTIESTLTVPEGTFSVNTTTGLVTFTPVASYFGTVTASYKVKDIAGGASNTVTIKVTIDNVNDAPAFDLIPDQRVFRNSNAKTITITGITAGPRETESVSITAFSGNTPLIQNPTITYGGGATATLTFKPQPNQFGTAEITVKAIDAGLKEFTQKFTITVVNVEITSEPVLFAIVGEPYQYNITITDIPETLTIAGAQVPSWATLTSTGKNTAVLKGTPPENATSVTVILQVKDGSTVLNDQTFTLLIKRNPSGTSFDVQTNEDVAVILSVNNFLSGFADPDNDEFSQLKITDLPNHGSLLLGTTPVILDQIIPVGSLGTLVYRPELNYVGKDTLDFQVGDEYSFSKTPNFISFAIAPVNDPPIITVIESEPLIVDIGNESPVVISPTFDAEDVDSELIVSAVIGFRLVNYDPNHDVLLFEDSGNIKGDWDEDTGILTLTGNATADEYVAAIRTVQYNFDQLYEIITDPRIVYFSLNDGIASGEEKERTINLIYNFVELNIPNVFTPDGNGSHDVWPFSDQGELEQYNTAEIRVFDERGRLVHETTGFGTPWDGKAQGTDVPAGTYFYTIDLNYGRIRYNGSLTILRAE
jgi:gliding motility-associated-like protein